MIAHLAVCFCWDVCWDVYWQFAFAGTFVGSTLVPTTVRAPRTNTSKHNTYCTLDQSPPQYTKKRVVQKRAAFRLVLLVNSTRQASHFLMVSKVPALDKESEGPTIKQTSQSQRKNTHAQHSILRHNSKQRSTFPRGALVPDPPFGARPGCAPHRKLQRHSTHTGTHRHTTHAQQNTRKQSARLKRFSPQTCQWLLVC